MSKITVSLGDHLRLIRRSKNLSLIEASKLIDINRNQLGEYENNKRIPSAKTLKKLSVFYKVSVDTLLKEKTPVVEWATDQTIPEVDREHLMDSVFARIKLLGKFAQEKLLGIIVPALEACEKLDDKLGENDDDIVIAAQGYNDNTPKLKNKKK